MDKQEFFKCLAVADCVGLSVSGLKPIAGAESYLPGPALGNLKDETKIAEKRVAYAAAVPEMLAESAALQRFDELQLAVYSESSQKIEIMTFSEMDDIAQVLRTLSSLVCPIIGLSPARQLRCASINLARNGHPEFILYGPSFVTNGKLHLIDVNDLLYGENNRFSSFRQVLAAAGLNETWDCQAFCMVAYYRMLVN